MFLNIIVTLILVLIKYIPKTKRPAEDSRSLCRNVSDAGQLLNSASLNALIQIGPLLLGNRDSQHLRQQLDGFVDFFFCHSQRRQETDDMRTCLHDKQAGFFRF